MARIVHLVQHSYRMPVIWSGVVVIVALGVVAALIGGLFRSEYSDPLHALETALIAGNASDATQASQAYLKEFGADTEAVVTFVLAVHRTESMALRSACADALQHAVNDEAFVTACDVLLRAPAMAIDSAVQAIAPQWDAWFEAMDLRPARPLPMAAEIFASIEPPDRWANRLAGEVKADSGDLVSAERFYRRAGQHQDAVVAREQAVELTAFRGDWAQLRQDANDPLWAPALGANQHLDLAIEDRNWLKALQVLPPAMYAYIDITMTIIAIVGALAWGAILWQFTHGAERRRLLLALTPALVFAGVVSTWLTIFILLIQERVFGFVKGDTSFDQAMYCIFGIGLREEFTKALCFLPFAPWLARRTQPIVWLVMGGMVGLGFAAEENVNYLIETAGGGIGGRFLTANFFHICLTGLVGMSLCEALRDQRQWGHALSIFLIAVIIHGLYDAFLIVDALKDYSLASFMILIGAAYYFFHVVHAVRLPGRPPVSTTATFAWGLSVTMAVAFALIGAQAGVTAAATILAPGLLGAALISIAYVRGINDGLSR